MLQDNKTTTQLRTNPLAKTQENLNALMSKLQKENKVTTGDAFKLKSSDAVIPRLYQLPKVHKNAISLRPIVSFIGSTTYYLSREIAQITKHLVGKSVCHVGNDEDFVNEIHNLSINQDESMASFDVVSLFIKSLQNWHLMSFCTDWSFGHIYQATSNGQSTTSAKA